MILALALAASVHWADWPANEPQMGVAIGSGAEERLIALIPAGGCAAGVSFYQGQYLDIQKAIIFLMETKACALSDARRKAIAKPAP